MEQIKLNQSALSKLKISKTLTFSQYDRNQIKPGIFHFGVGNFHRAHQALLLDDTFSQGLNKEFGIVGIGILPIDQKMKDVMKEQDRLYTVIEKASNGNFKYKIIGSIIDYMFAPDNVNEVIERLASHQAKIVSLTITEGGYEIDVEKVQDDLKNLSSPKTVFGIVVEALRRRKGK